MIRFFTSGHKIKFLFNRFVLLELRRCFSTMKCTVKEVLNMKNVDSTVTMCGWVRNIRRLKNAIFVDLDDGSCAKYFQVVINKDNLKGQNLNAGCSLQVEGTIVCNERVVNKVELVSTSVSIMGGCPIQVYPLRPKQNYSHDYLLNFLHLRPRTKNFSALLRLRSSFYMAIHEFFKNEGFVHVHTPILTSNDCEGAGEVFAVCPTSEVNGNNMDKMLKSFFNTSAYLTVSAQLHLESAMGGLSKVYTCNPTFRAENSKSRKHLSEFYMIEAEQAFVCTVDEIMDVVEKLVKCVSQSVVDMHKDDLDIIAKESNYDIEHFKNKVFSCRFPRLPYTEAVEILCKEHGPGIITWGQDFHAEHERLLVEHFDNVPVFVTHFPHGIKPFYMKRDSQTGKHAECFDLIAPLSGEICGGSIRENEEFVLQERLSTLGLDKVLSWYVDLRRYGSVPHGGFGLGFERYLQCILGIANIKDVIPYPRYPHHCQL